MSSRYAKPSKPTKKARLKLTKFQLVAAIGAMFLICGLVGGIVGTIVLDQMSNEDEDPNDAVINSSELLDQLRTDAEDNPESSMAQAAYANYLANTGDIQTAIPFYERAILLDPSNWSIRLDFSQSLSNNNLLADAELQLDRILELDRENAQGWFYLAELYQKFDPARTDEAIFAYEQVIRFDPESFIASQATTTLNQINPATPEASPNSSPEVLP